MFSLLLNQNCLACSAGSVEEAGAGANVDEVHLNITDEEKYFLKALGEYAR